jgi:DNA mismatch endonuclease (patch repair protein)
LEQKTRENNGSDNLTPEQRKRTMRSVHSEHTKPEMVVRRLVHRMGYRYRLHRRDLPGNPDLAFPGRKKVIFVHGCFWHGHDCAHGRKRPKANATYWNQKLDRNLARDLKNQTLLRQNGWDVMIIWECELRDLDGMRERIARFLE